MTANRAWENTWRHCRDNLLVVAAYAGCGLPILEITALFGERVFVWPGAGIGLGALLICGWRCAPGLWLGAMLTELVHAGTVGDLPAATVMASGYLAQAALGCALVRRILPDTRHIAIDQRILLALLLVGPLACLLSAGGGSLAQTWSATSPSRSAYDQWLNWWVADAIGAMLLLGPALVRSHGHRLLVWRSLLPTMITGSLLFAGGVAVDRILEQDRRENLQAAVTSLLEHGFDPAREQLAILEYIPEVLSGSSDPGEAAFRRHARKLMAKPFFSAVDWIVPVPESELRAHETMMQARGQAGYQVHRLDAATNRAPRDPRAIHFPVIYTARGELPHSVLGLDHGFNSARMQALRQARDTGQLAIALDDLVRTGGQLAALVFAPDGRPRPTDHLASAASDWPVAYAVGVLELHKLFGPLHTLAADMGLEVALRDITSSTEPRQLTGPAQPENAWTLQQDFSFGNRLWQLQARRAAGFAEPVSLRRYGTAFHGLALFAALLAGFATTGAAGRALSAQFKIQQATQQLRDNYAELESKHQRMRQAIGERLRAEAERDQFFSISRDLLAICSPDGRIIRCSPSLQDACGRASSQLIGRPLAAFVDPADHDALQALLENAQPSRHDRTDAAISDGNGRRRIVSWWVIVGPDQQRYLSGRDVTAERAHETELNEARARAELASEAKSTFLATMSHEIRTPMNGVVGMIEVLRQTALSSYQRELLDTVQTSGRTLLTLIDDILDFSKIEAGRLELETQPVHLLELAEGMADSMVESARRKNVLLRVFVSPALSTEVKADPTRLRQVIFNLLGNAIKFSADLPGRQGEVDLRLEQAADDTGAVLITVQDNGIGMPDGVLNNLFQPFTQGESSTTRRYGGTGLGLAISRRLVQLMGGQLTVESRPDQGSRFTIRLPLTAVGADITEPRIRLDGLSCMVVEGKACRAADAAAYLQAAGADVRVAKDLTEAASLTKSHPTKVIVHDAGAQNADIASLERHFGPTICHVALTRGRRRRPRRDGRIVTLDATAIRQRNLVVAVELAAHRDSALDPGSAGRAPTAESGAAAPLDPVTVAQEGAEASLDTRLPILVAEDDSTNQRVISAQLALLCFRADIATDGREALAMWREAQYSLVLADLHMPHLDGYALTRAIREQEPPGRHVPILALTANAMRGEPRQAREVGMDDYLITPIEVEALRAALQRHLSVVVSDATNQAVQSLELDVLARMVGADRAVMDEVLTDFRDTLGPREQAIRRAQEEKDPAALQSLAHQLKSASRSVGALPLGDICAELERLATTGDGSATDEQTAALLQELARVRQLIDKRLGGTPQTSPP